MKHEELIGVLHALTSEVRSLKESVNELQVAFGVWDKKQDEKTQDISKKLERHDERIDKHARRISALESKPSAAE